MTSEIPQQQSKMAEAMRFACENFR